MSRSISHQHHCVIGTVPDLRSAAIHKSEIRSSCCSGQANIWDELTSSIYVIVLSNKTWCYPDAPCLQLACPPKASLTQTLNAAFNISYNCLLKNLTLFDLPLETNIFVRVTVAGVNEWSWRLHCLGHSVENFLLHPKEGATILQTIGNFPATRLICRDTRMFSNTAVQTSGLLCSVLLVVTSLCSVISVTPRRLIFI
jgi:hypothetical protein